MNIDCIAIAAELPFESWLGGTLQPYADVVRAGLTTFFERLPARRRAAIDARLSELPATAPPTARAVALLHCCPTLHKLGQMLGRDRRLPLALRLALQQLERSVPRTPAAVVRGVVEHELGRDAVDVHLAPAPLAEASVAVVMPFDSPAGRGVFKVLKPDVDAHLNSELDIWQDVGRHISAQLAASGLPALDVSDLFERVHTALLGEIDPPREQRHLDIAARTLAAQDGVAVPRRLPWCTSRLTAMTRLDGTPITRDDGGSTRARRLVRAVVAQPILNPLDDTLFHGDPHAGNLLAMPDGGIGIVDWSLCGRLSKATRERIAQILVAAWAADADGVARHCAALATNAASHAQLRSVCSAALGNLAAPWIPGLRWLTGLLDAAALSAGCHFDTDLLLFRRMLLILEGVVADLDADCTLDRVMIECGLRQHCAESWLRPFTTPTSRAFGTHLSNLDLARLAWSAPPRMLRAWQGLIGAST